MGCVDQSSTSRLTAVNLIKSAIVALTRRGDRVVDGSSLENCRGATHREFESRPLRHRKRKSYDFLFLWFKIYVLVGAMLLPLAPPAPLNDVITKLTTA